MHQTKCGRFLEDMTTRTEALCEPRSDPFYRRLFSEFMNFTPITMQNDPSLEPNASELVEKPFSASEKQICVSTTMSPRVSEQGNIRKHQNAFETFSKQCFWVLSHKHMHKFPWHITLALGSKFQRFEKYFLLVMLRQPQSQTRHYQKRPGSTMQQEWMPQPVASADVLFLQIFNVSRSGTIRLSRATQDRNEICKCNYAN